MGMWEAVIMKRCLVLLFVFLLTFCALAEESYNLFPDPNQWGISRTKLRGNNNDAYLETEVDGYATFMVKDVVIDGYSMDQYYVFAEPIRNYYGLSSMMYLLQIPRKLSDSKLKDCYNTIVADMETALGKPASNKNNTAYWYDPDFTVRIDIAAYRVYNGSKNKTVGIVFTPPETTVATVSPAPTQRKTMKVSAIATCRDYNHVGNEWSQAFFINGEPAGRTIDLASGDTITVEAVITEEDKKPDIGRRKVEYKVTEQDLKNGFTIEFEVGVRENGGRYSGSEAVWAVVFSFK